MWMFFGLAAIGTTFWGLHCGMHGKRASFWAVLGMALTALTLCAEYQMIANWTRSSDWAAIEDVVPSMGAALWVLTGISIIMNLGTVLLDKKMRTLEK